MRKRLIKLAIVAFAVSLLFLHPLSKAVLIWILPLGSGIDDLIGIIGLVIGGIALFSWLWTGVPIFLRKKGKGE